MERKITTNKEKIGDLGEKIAVRYLENKGFRVVERNYRKKWGEIDIVCIKGRNVRFIEVKTISRNLGTPGLGTMEYRAEDNVHTKKLLRISRTIQSYLVEHASSIEGEWQFDLITVAIDKGSKKAKVECLDNVILQQT